MWDNEDYILLTTLVSDRNRGNTKSELYDIIYAFDAIDRSLPPIHYLNVAIKNFEEQGIFSFEESAFCLTEYGFEAINKGLTNSKLNQESLTWREKYDLDTKKFFDNLREGGIKTTTESIPKSGKIGLDLYELAYQKHYSRNKDISKKEERKIKKYSFIENMLQWIIKK